MTVDVFRQAMRKLPGGVVMVTTRVGGRPWGLTISSCCSMTAEPPQILISLESARPAVSRCWRRCFGVGILGGEHRSSPSWVQARCRKVYRRILQRERGSGSDRQ